ncbi:hypothetical protein E1A91_A09G270100v1 [Gossypium mustelinum]|uniref:Transmembrane protein n=4 Tax=Gossypium TaxID=3633 RepID=A0A2P5YF68_GOSBA|nr:hypothetical protein ES319_A09G265900v1 [Gossypium barbadense]PPS14184.1 hypothetical protein GOBAR_AA06349 [Gossypium barbadense]TYH04355.1 hypothetical protein ES288_A09G291600v1 [Gossypium darwinii]TYJ20507.1 hypothetical protein E1A91_A09G270100v1 [Gossypium mustelinum]
MYRSSSWSRVTDGYYSSPKAGSITGLRMSSSVDDSNEPPVYDPSVEMANKKEKSRAKFAENAVHIIPLVLLVCALILWFFSNPDVEVGTKVETVAARIDGLTIDGDIDNDSDGTQTGFLPIAEVGDVDSTKHPKPNKPSRKLHFSYPQFFDSLLI